ncbi:MAG: asparagine synthase (glutamine-hydrolyzing) [Anaerolineae bacterium]|nr:asparagine synthase (glutamine-hydrolyzing) [Anaerolineae bacterium]
MCGICGIWYFDRQKPVDAGLLRQMTDQIIHRGPDEDGFHLKDSIGLGFRRLSIIDVAGSHQPMPNENQRAWIVFNGEVYNFQDLRQQLTAHHTFATQGDTETILHAYEDYGAACVKYLRGMFAFAIWDSEADHLTLAVDRFGKKPLYYLLDEEKFIFASELKCILQHPGVSRDIDFAALDEYFYCGYITAPRSIFSVIRKISPGHTLTIKRGGKCQLEEYWHPRLYEPAQYDTRSMDDLAAELRELLTEAVKLRMISDVPLGAFLSGGIDSSSVVALMSQVSSQPVKTFSIGFDEQLFDETEYAQVVADYCQTDHTREVVRPDVINILPKLIHQYDEPFADASMIPTYYVSQAARQHVTVALSGDGGDEVFAGYHSYLYGFRQEFLRTFIPVPLRPAAVKLGGKLPKKLKVGTYLSVMERPIGEWALYTGLFNIQARSQLYAASFPMLGESPKREAVRQAEKLEWLSQLQYNDLRAYMPGDILVKVDRASMLASLEVRSPLLDHVVFEFMAKVPPRYKMTWGDSKILLKKALGNLLPLQIHKRGKQGFGIPLQDWLAKPLQPMLRDVLLDSTTRQRGLFNLAYVEKLLMEHTSYQVNHEYRLWALLCFELWARTYLPS